MLQYPVPQVNISGHLKKAMLQTGNESCAASTGVTPYGEPQVVTNKALLVLWNK